MTTKQPPTAILPLSSEQLSRLQATVNDFFSTSISVAVRLFLG